GRERSAWSECRWYRMVWPVRTWTLSPPAGTRPPSQVAGVDQGPLRALRTNFAVVFFFVALATSAGFAGMPQERTARKAKRNSRLESMAGPRAKGGHPWGGGEGLPLG